ncbi:MAG: thioesterase [Deltaproteobacteria bacterium HGW-Deltaproteobacteria-21]|nr:MAG: thioesterase [Deltaproteobacteria bacterium HGW-Deltaproteobacteria-21]
MAEIKTGLKGKDEMVVQREHLASTIGNTGAEVLSTHWVVLLMEKASRNAVNGLLPPGMITVGTMISIRHFAATPLGLKVTAEALLEKIEGRKLTFRVTVRDEFERIAEGANEQMIVSMGGFLGKVKKKCERMSGDKPAL